MEVTEKVCLKEQYGYKRCTICLTHSVNFMDFYLSPLTYPKEVYPSKIDSMIGLNVLLVGNVFCKSPSSLISLFMWKKLKIRCQYTQK